MGIKCGIVGLPNVGKSTLFNALTKAGIDAENFPFCTIEPNAGVVSVPDPRQDAIQALVNPERCIPATMEFVDIAGLVAGASKGEGLGNQFLANIRETDAIAHVVRCFEDPNVIHVANQIDPLADIETINTELALADLESCEKQLQRVIRTAKSGDKTAVANKALLEDKLLPHLNEALPVRALDLDENEQALVKMMHLLTTKPTMYIANVAEDGFEDNPHLDAVKQFAEAENAGVVAISTNSSLRFQNWKTTKNSNSSLIWAWKNLASIARFARATLTQPADLLYGRPKRRSMDRKWGPRLRKLRASFTLIFKRGSSAPR